MKTTMKRIFLFSVAAVVATGCSIYGKYKRPENVVATDSLYRADLVEGVEAPDTTTIAYMSWEEVFTDAYLQNLIRLGLDSNVNLQSAILRVEAAKAQLSAAKWAYAPSIVLAPQGGLTSIDGGKASWSYNLGASASWDIDLFGSLLNAKRGAQAALLQQDAYRQAVKSQLIATIANSYYGLLMLDEQVKISGESIEIWREQVRTLEAKLKVGLVTENAVTQARANLYGLEASHANLEKQLIDSEYSLCALLGMPQFRIERNSLAEQTLPDNLNVGLPIQLLENRPDVKQAEMTLASAYYSTNRARSAFYPGLKLSGSAGWTNSLGQAVSNPGAWLLNALASLSEPIFNHGKLVANLKVSKAEEEVAKLNYRQTILDAGRQVNSNIVAIETATTMLEKHTAQCRDLERTVKTAEDMYRYSSAGSYLEILTARQSLLSAQLNAISDQYQRLSATVLLYQSLGGGR